MRKMVVVFIALLLATATYFPACAASIEAADRIIESQPSDLNIATRSITKKLQHGKWKSSERYQILSIDGIQETYKAGGAINLFVQGESQLLEVTEENGFYVAATVFALPKIKGERVPVVYDENKRAWRLFFTAPTDTTKQYEIVVHLFCGGNSLQNNRSCETVHGERTQIDKSILIPVY